MTRFIPGAHSQREFRDALGRFATGVTLVTCSVAKGPLGIIANSFASVSLDPPLVLWSPARSSRRFPAFAAAEHFAIHILSRDQVDLSRRFARTGHAFDGLDWRTGDHGVPELAGCLARFDCTREAAHDGGDHLIIVGRVRGVEMGDGAPLVFSSGRYGGFTDAQ